MKFTAVCVAAFAGVAGAFKLNLDHVQRLGANTWNYGDPALGCQTGEMNVSLQGLTGDYCAPACSSTVACPTSYPPGVSGSTAGQCAVEQPGDSQPTLCVLICTPGAAGACGTGASCKPIQGVGVCTYP